MMSFSRRCLVVLWNNKNTIFIQPARKRSGFFYSKITGLSLDIMSKMQRRPDLTLKGIKNRLIEKKKRTIRADQKSRPEMVHELGPDLAAAHFVVARGGAVKFVGFDKWTEQDKKGMFRLPSVKTPSLIVEAIDCSNMNIMYDSFDNFNNLSELKYLKLSGCQEVDDWCMDRIVMFRDKLVHLDLSSCPNVSERGLAVLHKMRKLRRLEIGNMTSVKQPQLIAIMLEDSLPDCEVTGVNFDEKNETYDEVTTPEFIINILERVDKKQLEDEKYYH